SLPLVVTASRSEPSQPAARSDTASSAATAIRLIRPPRGRGRPGYARPAARAGGPDDDPTVALEHEALVGRVRVDAGLGALHRARLRIARGGPARDPSRDALVRHARLVGIRDRPGVMEPGLQPLSGRGERVGRVAC